MKFGALTIGNVARFQNTMRLTLRYSSTRNADYTVTASEDTLFAPGIGMVKATRMAIDSTGATIEPTHTLTFASAVVGGVTWLTVPPPPPTPIEGEVLDPPLVHNDLVYDALRNRFCPSVPGSEGNKGNRIATLDPAIGHLVYSPPIGSEPNALSLSEDRSVLYVGLDGSGEVVRFALPSMVEQGRTRLVSDPFFGPSRAETVAVLPADPTVVAVSMAWLNSIGPRHAGVTLLRDSIMQPNRTQSHTGSNVVVFNSAGTALYGLNTETSEFGLRRIEVLVDGFVERQEVGFATAFGRRAFGFTGNRVIAGQSLFNTPALTLAGSIKIHRIACSRVHAYRDRIGGSHPLLRPHPIVLCVVLDFGEL